MGTRSPFNPVRPRGVLQRGAAGSVINSTGPPTDLQTSPAATTALVPHASCTSRRSRNCVRPNRTSLGPQEQAVPQGTRSGGGVRRGLTLFGTCTAAFSDPPALQTEESTIFSRLLDSFPSRPAAIAAATDRGRQESSSRFRGSGVVRLTWAGPETWPLPLQPQRGLGRGREYCMIDSERGGLLGCVRLFIRLGEGGLT